MNQQMAEAAIEKILQRVPTHHFNERPKANLKKQTPPDTPTPSRKTDEPLPWVTQNTAIIIVHGIGNQLPMETLDMFGRGLVSEYARHYSNQITLHHSVVAKETDS